MDRVAEVVRGHEGSPPKSLDSDDNFKPEHTRFCRKLRFVAIYVLVGDVWAKKVSFMGQKQCFLGKKSTIREARRRCSPGQQQLLLAATGFH